MGVTTLDPVRYGELCAEAIPKLISNDREFDRMAKELENLAFRDNPTPEETALAELLAKLIQDYDDRRHLLPDLPPHKLIRFLINQRGLRQADLLPIFGARSIASAVLNGRREPSKTHIRRLAEFFQVPAGLFL
jgi:HTH-type transcriptional regulator / antitoxin HigA